MMNKKSNSSKFLTKIKWTSLLVSCAMLLPVAQAEPYHDDAVYEITVPVRMENIENSPIATKTISSIKRRSRSRIVCSASEKLITDIADANTTNGIPYAYSAPTIANRGTKYSPLGSVTMRLIVPYNAIKKYPYYFCAFDVLMGSKKSDRKGIQESKSRLLVSGKFPTKSQ